MRYPFAIVVPSSTHTHPCVALPPLSFVPHPGGLVVHTSSGISAFVLTFWLGRSKVNHRPHNVPYVLLGVALLWFG